MAAKVIKIIYFFAFCALLPTFALIKPEFLSKWKL
jgi:hypothetical protein